MGVSKVILVDPNTQTPEVLMDVTGDDTSAGVLLAGNVGTRNDGEKVTGNIPEKTSSDLSLTLDVSGVTVTAPAGHYAEAASKNIPEGSVGSPDITVASNGMITVTQTCSAGYIRGGSGTYRKPLSTQSGKTVSPTESEQTAVATGKYTTGEVKVGAISSDYVGSGITRRSSTDLTSSNATVTAPAGYYSAAATKTVPSGTEGMPTATKGTVSNHSVSVTPSVTNRPGYIPGSWIVGSAVTVSASELVSGTKSITDNGTGIDVTNYATVDVAVAGGSPVAGLTNALEFRSVSSFTIKVSNAPYNFYWDGTIEWTDGVQPWAIWDGLTTLTASDGVLYLRGTNNTQISGNHSFGGFTLTGTNISCNGNIETLLDYATVARGEHPVMADYCYYALFSNCTALVSAPALPATELTEHCYQTMFYGCTNLVSAPALPATTLSSYCYGAMFSDCTSLTSAPDLPATTAALQCYISMFRGCTSLTSAPTLALTTLAVSCCSSMFSDCTSLATAPALPATTLEQSCYMSMFYGCTALTSAPALPAMTLKSDCYSAMFQGCTHLVSAPALPATTLSSYCYSSMFKDCTSLTSAPALPATTVTYDQYYSATYCYSQMFYGCTALTTPPVISLTKLGTYCFNKMFYGCTSLTSVPALPVATLRNYCYYQMFYGCTSLKVSATYDATTYPYTLRIPKTGTGSAGTSSLDDMFTNTGGSFTGTPSLNTDYYTENPLVEATA